MQTFFGKHVLYGLQVLSFDKSKGGETMRVKVRSV